MCNLDGLQKAGDGGRQWEFVSRTGVFRASNHEQETLGAIESNRKQQEVIGSRSSILRVYSPTTHLGLGLGYQYR